MARHRLPRLPRILRARAAEILALPRQQLTEPITEVRRDDYHEAIVVLRPLGHSAAPGLRLPGSHFSDLEQRIFDALAAGPLLVKQIAKAIGVKNSPSFRAIVGNLARRQAILPAPGGYRQAPLEVP